MKKIDYILLFCGGLVVGEAAIISALNKKRGFWQPTHKLHLLSVILYCVLLSAIIYSSQNCNRSNNYCDKLWKICSMLYNIVTMSVYSFYWEKSRLVHTIQWKGKHYYERVVIAMIAGMGLGGLCLLWLPIEGVQYGAALEDGECQLDERRWIAYVWVVGDTVISVMLLWLFIRPLRDIKNKLGDSPRSVAVLFGMRRLITKNRNLLFFTVLFTFVIVLVAAIQELEMRTCIHLLAIDRLMTLQCITMTFSYSAMEYFHCQWPLLSCWKQTPKAEDDTPSFDLERSPRTLKSSSIIHMAPVWPSTVESDDTTQHTVSVQCEPENSEIQGDS